MKPFDLMVAEARKYRNGGGDWIQGIKRNNPGASSQRITSIIKLILWEVMYPGLSFAELKRFAKQHAYGN